MANQTEPKKSGFFSLIKNLFILLLFLQFAPTIIINIKNYIKEAITPKSQVGLLKVRGLIEDSSFYVKKIQKFLKDPEIKALLLKIDCPGGLPGSSQAVFSELKRFKKEKPVVVYVENVCASGGYYVAAASNHIISTPSALIGSIGVCLSLPNVKERLNDWKIKFNYIQSGKYKTMGSPLRDTTPEELDFLQNLSNNHYEQFIKDMSQSRNLDIQKQKTWADGKVFAGNEALKLNLIDQIGAQEEAIEKIKELAKIETEIKFIRPVRPSFLARLFGAGEENGTSPSFSSYIATTLSDIYDKFVIKQTTECCGKININ